MTRDTRGENLTSIGKSLGRYHILEQLGEGGMAAVYKAYDVRLERNVAIKVILPQKQSSADFLKRFDREARALARLSHPHIVKVLDYGEQKRVPYLVMEYQPGGTLKGQVGTPMPWKRAAEILASVARALEYAHQLNFIHRDIKPSNILITQQGEPMLSDFGIAKVLESEETLELTGSGVGIGTPEYMAPEQGLGEAVDRRADIYALGIIFYELVTGRKPYRADTPMAVLVKKATEPLPRPGQFVANLPERVEQVLVKALARQPENRYPDMGAFAKDLEELAAGITRFDTSSPIPVEKKGANKTRAKRGLLIIPIVAVVCILLAIAGGAFGLKQLAIWPFAARATATIPITVTVAPDLDSEITPTLQDMATPDSPVEGRAVIYVPAGAFTMGSDSGNADERPAHSVTLDAFWIDKTEVTNDMFMQFVNTSGYVTEAERSGQSWIYNGKDWVKMSGVNWQHPEGTGSNIAGKGAYPVLHVSWYDASAYCAWVGGRLPTEAEWEKAARGTDARTYPWGSQAPDGSLLNFADVNLSVTWANTSTDDGYKLSAPAGSYPDGGSPYGVLDMAGNVWEWVSDWYNANFYSISPDENPQGPVTGDSKVLRGGSWYEGGYDVRTTSRVKDAPGITDLNSGFRCVWDEP